MNDNLTKHPPVFLYMPKTFFNKYQSQFDSYPGWASMSSQQGFGELLGKLFFPARLPRARLGSRPQPQPPFFFLKKQLFSVEPYLGKTWSQPPFFVNGSRYQHSVCTGLDREKIQYLAYLRDQNLALWGRWRGRGTRRGRGRAAAACWPTDTPAPGCGMGCHARSGL